MMQTTIKWLLTVSAQEAPSEEDGRTRLEQHLDQVMEALIKLDACNLDVHDPALSADFSAFPKVLVEVELVVNGHGPDALGIGGSVLRSAIHTAGGCTPDWRGSRPAGTCYEELSVQLEPA